MSAMPISIILISIIMLLSFISIAFVDVFLNRKEREGMKLHRVSGILMGRKRPIVFRLATSRNLDFLILYLPHLSHSWDPLFLSCF